MHGAIVGTIAGSRAILRVSKTLFAAGDLYVPSLAGAHGSTMSSVSSVSPATLTLAVSPTPPKIAANSVHGDNAAMLLNDAAPYQYLTCDSVAPSLRSATGSWTIPMRVRVDKTGEMPLWSLLCSSGDPSEQLWLRVVGDALVVRKKIGGVTTNLTCPTRVAPYDDAMIAVVCNAGSITVYERPFDKSTETITALGALAAGDFSSAMNRFSFGASVSSGAGEPLSGYFAGCGVKLSAAFSASDVHQLFDEWQFDAKLRKPLAAQWWIEPGDSIMTEAQDLFTVAGMRNMLGEFAGTNGLDIIPRGGTEAGGVGRQGTGRYLQTSANSGQTIDQISAQALIDISNSGGKVGFWFAYMGGGDNNALIAPATICSNYVTKFTLVMNALIAQDPGAWAVVSRLIPNQTGSIQANLVALNALWAASVIAPLQAAFPGRLHVADWFTAVGTVHSGTYFADSGHLNRAGCVACALHPTYGSINALNELGETAGARMLRSSPTINRVAAAVAITSPAPAANIVHGVPTTIAIDCSRIGGKVELLVNGAVRDLCQPVDIYDFVVVSGSYVKKPHISWADSLSALIGDVGSCALSARHTDVDGTVTTSATVTITVT